MIGGLTNALSSNYICGYISTSAYLPATYLLLTHSSHRMERYSKAWIIRLSYSILSHMNTHKIYAKDRKIEPT
jgi:hypothetical protein